LTLNIKLYKDENIVIDKSEVTYHQEGDIIYFSLEQSEHQIDLKNHIFERYNDEFHFSIDFKKETCTYELKEHQAIFNIIVDASFYEQKDNQIEIAYALETDDQKSKRLIELY